jgi:predicted Zn-dependent protease
MSCKKEGVEFDTFGPVKNVVHLEFNQYRLYKASEITYAAQIVIQDSLKAIFAGIDILFTTDSFLIGQRIQKTIITKSILSNEHSGITQGKFAGSYPNFVFNRGERPGIIAYYIAHETGHAIGLKHSTGHDIMNGEKVYLGARFNEADINFIQAWAKY